MPYIGNVLTSFAVETGNINDQAVTAPKLSATGGTDGQILALDSNLDLEWVSDPAGQWVTSGSNIHYNDGNVGIGLASPSDLLEITPTSTREGLTIKTTGTSFGGINIDTNRTGAGHTLGDIRFMWDGTGVAGITGHTGSDTTNKDDGRLIFNTASAGSATERMRIDNSGRLLVGLSTARQTGSGFTAFSQVEGGDSVSSGSLTITSNRSIDDLGARLNFARSKGGSVGSNTIVDNNAELGGIYFWGADGTDLNTQGAEIIAEVDGTPGSNDMPTRLVFGTTSDGGSSPTERMRIDSSGRLGVGLTPSSTASITNVDAGLIQTDGNIDIRYPGTNSDPAGTRYLSFVNTDSTLVADQPMGGIRWVGNDTSNTSRDTASILAFCQSNSGTSSNITFNNNGGTERMRIDSSGRLLLGLTSGRAVGGGTQSLAQIETTSQNGLSFVAHRGTNTSGSILILGKSRGTAVGSNTIVANGDELGALRFAGADGTDVQSRAASIAASVDGTPGSNDMPGRLTFNTTADGASTPTERMRIDSSGNVGIATSSPQVDFHIGNADGASRSIVIHTQNNGEARLRFREGSTVASGYNEYSIGMKGASDGLTFEIQGQGEVGRFDGSGRLLAGLTSFPDSDLFVVRGAAGEDNEAFMSLVRGSAPANNQNLGMIRFHGNGNQTESARITALRDGGTWTAGSSHPGRIVFSTTADGASSPTERLRITSDGTIQLRDSPGIDFSQIQTNVGGMTSETLDSYEEGTWTPVPQFGGGTTGITYTTSPTGNYTKIGNLVFVVMGFQFSNKGSSTGSFTVSGLPFAVGATASFKHPNSVVNAHNMTNANKVYAALGAGTSLNYRRISDSNADSVPGDGDFQNNSGFYHSLVYTI